MEPALRRTALYPEHLALHGRMVPFAGYELPVLYEETGPTREHLAARSAAGLFDIDHMGQIRVSGPEAEAFLSSVQTVDLSRVGLFRAQYSLLPDEDGYPIDDIFLYRLDDAWWVIVNAVNRERDVAWLQQRAVGYDVTVENISETTYMLALQGPKAQEILQPLVDIDLSALSYHDCAWATLAGVPTLFGASGYTGEYGYELYFPATEAVPMWRKLLEAGRPAGLLPCGLAARDSLRIEAGLPLYGHETGPDVDPFTGGQGSFVHFDNHEFIGREPLLAMKAGGTSKKIIGFEMREPSVAREGYPVLAGGKVIGKVTSGVKSPTLGTFIGMALVQKEYAAVGSEIAIQVRDAEKKAVVVKRPFYLPAYRRAATPVTAG